MLTETYVGDDLSTNVIVEQLDKLLAAHAQVGTQGRNGESHEECLVADAHIGCVAHDGRAGNQRPRLHKPFLQQRGLETLHTQVAHDEVVNLSYFASEHRIIYNLRIFYFRLIIVTAYPSLYTTHYSVHDMEETVVEVSVTEYLVEVVAVGVSNKYLSELLA